MRIGNNIRNDNKYRFDSTDTNLIDQVYSIYDQLNDTDYDMPVGEWIIQNKEWLIQNKDIIIKIYLKINGSVKEEFQINRISEGRSLVPSIF